MTALVLQARLDSSRLPGKALLPLGGEPMILRVMQALRFVPCDQRVLACPADSEEAFRPLAWRAGFDLFVGPKEDVLARYCGAIRKTGADRIIRATGDNPFAFADAAAEIAAQAEALGSDYAAFAGLVYGAGVEAVAAEALLAAEREAVLPAEREHVCPFLYSRPDRFLLHRPACPAAWRGPGRRITVDTREDYERALALFDELGGPPSSGAEVQAALDRLERRPGGEGRPE